MAARGTLSIHIARPVEAVFAYVADVSNNPTWRTAVVEAAWLDPEPTGPGRRGRQTSRVLGRRYSVIAEVVDWDPPNHVSWATVEGAANVRTHCYVEPDGDGSRFTLTSEGELSGAWRVLTPLAAMLLRRSAASDADRLRAVLGSSEGRG